MELEFVEWLRQRMAPAAQVKVGIGDDAAVLQMPADGESVVTTDMLMDGIDFDLTRVEPARIGRKSLAVSLSDLAAMAARPVAAFVSLALPRDGGFELARQLYLGLLPLAEQFEIPIAGGDTNSWDGPLVISVTAVGAVTGRGALLRSGARPGDVLLATGEFGGSILGRHFDFQPRVREARWLHEQFDLHAGIDVSDGLSLDAARLAEASHCGVVLELSTLPVSPDAFRLAQEPGNRETPLEHALADGEDFELLLAATPEEAARILAAPFPSVPMRKIGYFVRPRGLWTLDPAGALIPMKPRGFEHRLT